MPFLTSNNFVILKTRNIVFYLIRKIIIWEHDCEMEGKRHIIGIMKKVFEILLRFLLFKFCADCFCIRHLGATNSIQLFNRLHLCAT